MKNYFTTALCALLLVGCSTEDDLSQTPAGEGKEFEIEAVIADDNTSTPDSRVAFELGTGDKGLKGSWEAGDLLHVYVGSFTDANHATFTYQLNAENQMTFRGTLPRTPAVGEKIYAYVENGENYSQQLFYRAVRYDNQKGVLLGSLQPQSNRGVMLYAEGTYAGEGQKIALQFHHLNSVFKLTFQFPSTVAVGATVTALGITAASGLYSKVLYDANSDYALLSSSTTSMSLTASATVDASRQVTVDASRQATVYLYTASTTVKDVYGTATIGSTSYISSAQVIASKSLDPGKVYANKTPIPMVVNELVASSFAGGTGTEADPYQISKVSELRYLAKLSEATQGSFGYDEFYKLTADIDLGNGAVEWTPISACPDNGRWFAFHGTFDGGGHTIRGTMKIPSGKLGGLFGAIFQGTVKNVKMAATVIGSSSSFGCGAIAGKIFRSGTIINCTNAGSVTSTAQYVGGIVGLTFLDVVEGPIIQVVGCANTGAVTATGTTPTIGVGGIVGQATNSTVTKYAIVGCINKGDVAYSGTRSDNSGVYVGGLVGSATSAAVTTLACWSTAGALTNNCAIGSIGLLAGQNSGTLDNCCYRPIGSYGTIGTGSAATNCTSFTDTQPTPAQISAMNAAWKAYDDSRAYRFNASNGEVEAGN